jgi:hypothetical protein
MYEEALAEELRLLKAGIHRVMNGLPEGDLSFH